MNTRITHPHTPSNARVHQLTFLPPVNTGNHTPGFSSPTQNNTNIMIVKKFKGFNLKPDKSEIKKYSIPSIRNNWGRETRIRNSNIELDQIVATIHQEFGYNGVKKEIGSKKFETLVKQVGSILSVNPVFFNDKFSKNFECHIFGPCVEVAHTTVVQVLNEVIMVGVENAEKVSEIQSIVKAELESWQTCSMLKYEQNYSGNYLAKQILLSRMHLMGKNGNKDKKNFRRKNGEFIQGYAIGICVNPFHNIDLLKLHISDLVNIDILKIYQTVGKCFAEEKKRRQHMDTNNCSKKMKLDKRLLQPKHNNRFWIHSGIADIHGGESIINNQPHYQYELYANGLSYTIRKIEDNDIYGKYRIDGKYSDEAMKGYDCGPIFISQKFSLDIMIPTSCKLRTFPSELTVHQERKLYLNFIKRS